MRPPRNTPSLPPHSPSRTPLNLSWILAICVAVGVGLFILQTRRTLNSARTSARDSSITMASRELRHDLDAFRTQLSEQIQLFSTHVTSTPPEIVDQGTLQTLINKINEEASTTDTTAPESSSAESSSTQPILP